MSEIGKLDKQKSEIEEAHEEKMNAEEYSIVNLESAKPVRIYLCRNSSNSRNRGRKERPNNNSNSSNRMRNRLQSRKPRKTKVTMAALTINLRNNK